MTLPALTSAWSNAVTITNETHFECRQGLVYVAYGATALDAPASLEDGIRLQQGDALTLNGGQDFRVRSPNPTHSILWYGEQGA